MKIINRLTGEVLNFNDRTYEEVLWTWKHAQELERIAKTIKDKLKPKVRDFIVVDGVTEPLDGYQFRKSVVQRYNYNKSTLRQYLDPDVVDVLTKVDKTAVDRYLKENFTELGSIADNIRQSAIPEGKPYEVIKLENLNKGDK